VLGLPDGRAAPNCPNSSLPQQYAAPARVTPHAPSIPTSTRVNVWPPLTAVGSGLHANVVVPKVHRCGAVAPMPSLPNAWLPQQ
jgi:hypothetical protein